MLTSGIFEAYKRGVQQLAAHVDVREVARGQAAQEVNRGQPALFVTGAKEFLADHALGEEVFGAASLIVRCPDVAALRQVLERLEGQLTVTLQMEDSDSAAARAAAGAGAQSRAPAGEWLADRRGSLPRDGAWRPVPGDVG